MPPGPLPSLSRGRPERNTGRPEAPDGRRLPGVLAIASLWIAAAIFYGPVLFGGRSLYFRDTVVYYLPQALVTSNALAAGTLPHWVSSIGAGYPFLADPHSAALYPLSALLLALPFPRSYNVAAVVHVPLAGTFLYLLLRRWRLSRASSWLGAALFMFNGYTVSLTSLVISLRGVTWMPLSLLFFERFIASGRAFWLPAVSATLAVAATGTDPQHILFTAALLAMLPWLRPQAGRPAVRRLAAALAACGILAAGLAAVQLVPLLELFGHSSRQGGISAAELGHYALSPWQLLHAALPVIEPDPSSPLHAWSFPGTRVPYLQDIYFGAPAILLALAALAPAFARRSERPRSRANPSARSPKGPSRTAAPPSPERFEGERRTDAELPAPELRRSALLFFSLAVAGVLLSLGDATPFFGAVTTLVPPLGLFRYPAKYWLLTALGVSVLAALGLESAGRGHPGARRTLLATSAIACALLLLATLALPDSGIASAASFLGAGAAAVDRSLLSPASHVADGWLLGSAAPLAATLLLAALALGLRSGRCPPAVASPLAALLAVAAVACGTLGSAPSAPDAFVESPPRTADLLRKLSPGPVPPRFSMRAPSGPRLEQLLPTSYDKFRVGKDMMSQLRGIAHGVGALHASPALGLAAIEPLHQALRSLPADRAGRLAAAAGASYLLEFGPTAPSESSRPLGRIGLLTVSRLLDPSPRAFIAPLAIPADGADDSAATPPIGPGPTEALTVERIAALPDTVSYSGGSGSLRPASIERCEVMRYSDTALEVAFSLKGRGLLVVLDQHYPGWEARVDGERRPIHPVAGLFRGVEVREGEGTLRMTFEPRAFRAGLVLSLLSAGLAAALGVARSRLSPAPRR